MSEDGTGDGGPSFERRSVLKNAAVGVAGVGGLAPAVGASDAGEVAGGANEAREVTNKIEIRGDLDPAGAAATLWQLDGFEGVASADRCYVETKSYDDGSGDEKLAYRECCVRPGCGEWTYTDASY